MAITKRRGRPAGTDYKEDLEALSLIADRLIADEALTPWPVMWAVCKMRKWRGSTDEAIVARWVRKWKAQSSAQLEAARQRRADRQTRPLTVTIGHQQLMVPALSPELSANIKRFLAEMAVVTEPTRKAMEQIARNMNTPEMRAFCEKQRKIAEDFAASPVFKEIQRISEQMKNLPPIHIPKHIWGG
jgi:hypothetical protein